MIGYVGIGFLTMGKAMLPLLPQEFTLTGIHFDITLMGLVIVIRINYWNLYYISADKRQLSLLISAQGFILLFAGVLVFFLGVSIT